MVHGADCGLPWKWPVTRWRWRLFLKIDVCMPKRCCGFRRRWKPGRRRWRWPSAGQVPAYWKGGQDGKDVEVLIEENGKKTQVSGKTIILRNGKIAEVHQEPNPGAASDPTAAKSTYRVRISTGQVDAKKEAGSRAVPSQKGPGLDSNGEYRVIHGTSGGSLQIERWLKRPGEDPRKAFANPGANATKSDAGQRIPESISIQNSGRQ
jgi:hypothetical protein